MPEIRSELMSTDTERSIHGILIIHSWNLRLYFIEFVVINSCLIVYEIKIFLCVIVEQGLIEWQ